MRNFIFVFILTISSVSLPTTECSSQCVQELLECMSLCGGLEAEAQNTCLHICVQLYNQCAENDRNPKTLPISIDNGNGNRMAQSQVSYDLSSPLLYAGILVEKSVYPNPTSSNAIIELRLLKEQNLQISILDISGKTLKQNQTFYEEGNQILDLDLEGLNQGIYFVNVKSGEYQESFKVIKS